MIEIGEASGRKNMKWALRRKRKASRNNMYGPCRKHKDAFITVEEGVEYEHQGQGLDQCSVQEGCFAIGTLVLRLHLFHSSIIWIC